MYRAAEGGPAEAVEAEPESADLSVQYPLL
jgi:hypothetical protein